MNSKRIGIDARMYGSGFTGIGRYNFELIHHLARLDSENEYYIFLRKEAYEAFVPPNDRFKKVLADFGYYSIAEQTAFLFLLYRFRLDLMHFTHFNVPILYFRPYVVTVHDLIPTFFPGKKMNRIWYRWPYRVVLYFIAKFSSAIISVSRHTKKDIIEQLHVHPKKIQVIYNGVNSEFSTPSKTSHADLMKKLGLQRPFFLYTGVWRDHKNLVGLIQAFSLIHQKYNGEYELVITGRHNPTYHEVPDTIESLNLKGVVHLVGMVSEEDLKALYQHAFCYVFPSFYEGFGLPPLESMQSGTPVIASNQSSVPEVCGEEAALFFDPYQVDDIAAKMKMMIIDPSVRQRLVNNGYERVKFFSWNKMAKSVFELYQQMFNEKIK